MNTGHYLRIINQASLGYVYGSVEADEQEEPVAYNLLEVNPAFEKLSGLSAPEILNRRFTKQTPGAAVLENIAIRQCAEIAVRGGESSLDHCPGTGNQWFNVRIWAPEKYRFVATWTPIDNPGKVTDRNAEERLVNREYEMMMALRESEERYRTLFAHTPLGIVHFDMDSIILDVNMEFVKVIGSSREALIGFNIYKQVDNPEMLNAIRSALSGNTGHYEGIYNSVTAPKQTYVRGLFVSYPGDDGRIIGGVGIFEDITGRKAAREALEMARQTYFDILNSVSESIYVLDENGIFIEVNRGAEKMYGYSHDELIGKSPLTVAAPGCNKLDEIMCKMDEVVETGMPAHFDFWAMRKNGEVFPKEVIVNKGRYFGKDVLIATARDVTASKQAERFLKNSLARNKALLDANPDTIFMFNEKGVIIEIHAAEQNGLDVKPELFIGKTLDEVFPGEMADVTRDKVATVYASGETVDATFKMNVHGAERHFESRYVPCGNHEVMAIVRDITESKNTEEALRESESQKAAILRAIPDLLFVFNRWGDYLNVYTEDDGKLLLPREQLVGKNLRELFPADVAEQALNAFQQSFSTNELVEFSYTIQNGGKTEFFEARIVPTSEDKVLAMVRDITSRKLAGEALMESEQKFRLIAENISDGILFLDTERKIQYVSPSYMKQFGYSETEELGRDRDSIYTLVHPDDREALFAKIFNAIELKKTELSYTYRVKHREGHYVWREDNAKFNYDEQGNHLNTYVICRDISARKNAEQQISLLGKSIEQSPVSIIITDPEGTIEYVNPKFEEVTGYSFHETIGQNPRILKSGTHTHEVYEELWQTILSGQQWFGEIHNKKKNGVLFWENISISPILNPDGKVTHFVAVKEDITEKKQMIEDLVRAKEKAEESDHLKSAFLANMSHEIRTPMNGILGFAALLKEPDFTGEEQMHHISIIEKSGIRMLNIINDIIDLSKIESGQMDISISETDINGQTEYIFTFFKPEVEAKGMQLFIRNTLPSEAATIRTDREKIYAILTNLVKNAIKYTREGFIEFGYEKKGRFLEFYVKDTGMGIAGNRQEAIFERFVQADISDKQAMQGAGLGLSITKAYVEMLGGKIRVESEPGRGSVFYFTIPYTPVKNSEMDASGSISATAESYLAHKLKILIAEDDVTSDLLISRMLKNTGREFLHAKTGLEAVETCRNNPDIDLIMMDLKMPEMDGYEATRNIRKFNRGVVIISQTAYGLAGDREKALQAGCNDYLPKPLQKADMMDSIRRFFEPTPAL
ncbi:MAG: PAS domain S-box protein [Bacteroidota bacterium]